MLLLLGQYFLVVGVFHYVCQEVNKTALRNYEREYADVIERSQRGRTGRARQEPTRRIIPIQARDVAAGDGKGGSN